MDRTLKLQVIFGALDRLTGPMRNIANGSRRMQNAMRANREEITRLERRSATAGRFRELQRGLTGSHQKLDELRRKLRAAGEAYEASGRRAGRLRTQYQALQRQEAALTRQTEQQAAELARMARAYRTAGIDVSRLDDHIARNAEALRREREQMRANRAELERMNAARRQMESTQALGQDMKSGGQKAVAAGGMLGAALYVPTKSAMDYQSQMTDIGQKADMTRAQSSKLGANLDKLGPKVAQLPSKLAEAVDVLAGKGLDPRVAANTMVEPIGRAATAYNAEMEDLANATYAGVDNLEIPVKNTAQMLDIMAQAGKSGSFEMKDMASHFPALTASAAALKHKGVPAVADLAAALQIVRGGTGDSAVAANNLQNLMTKIITPDTIKNFKKFGVDLEKEMKLAAEKGKSPIEAIIDLTKQATKGDTSKLAFLFGDQQAQSALRMLVENTEEYRKIRADALAANGTVERDFAVRMQDANAVTNQTMARLQALGHVIGNALLPVVTQFISWIGNAASHLSAFAEAHPGLISVIAKVLAVLAVLLVVLGSLAIVIGTVLGPFALLRFALAGAMPVLSGLRTAFTAGGVASKFFGAGLRILGIALRFMLGPVGLIITVLAILAYAVYNNWDKIKLWWTQATTTIAANFQYFVGKVQAIFAAISAAFAIGAGWVSAGWSRVKQMFLAAMAFYITLPLRFAAFGANIISGLINGITNGVGRLKNAVIGLATKVGDWFKQKLGIKSPSRLFMAFGGHITEGLAIGVQKGSSAPVKRVSSLAGRLAGAMVTGMPVAAAAASGGAPAGNTYNITIKAAPGMDTVELARLVRQEIEAAEARKSARSRSAFRDDED